MAGTRGIAVLVLAGLAAWAGVQPTAGAAAANRGTYSVTVVARQCPSFDAIMANREPGNRQESRRALGKKSVYVEGEPVSPAIEEANNPGCTPLEGWRFQFGGSDSGRRVNGLSTVGDPGRVTRATTTVPLLDDQGRPTDRSIAGAVTVELDADQLALAQRGDLFIQGGTADDPLLYSSAVNADRLHGFGALRCAVDQVYGDNVERISYPPGVRHVFCYYFTVEPLPGAGTIVVRKEVTGRDSATFQFRGSISFAPGGRFDLTVDRGRPAEMRFRRAAGETWNFTELPHPDYQPARPPSCESENGRSTFYITGQRVGVVLRAGDRVVCTYRNERRPSHGESAPSLGILLPIVATVLLLIGLGIMLLLRRKCPEGGGTSSAGTKDRTELHHHAASAPDPPPFTPGCSAALAGRVAEPGDRPFHPDRSAITGCVMPGPRRRMSGVAKALTTVGALVALLLGGRRWRGAVV